jgi:hypothetical protein
MTKTKQWLKADEKLVSKAIRNGEPREVCDCCGGYLPPIDVWETLRATGRGPDCDGSMDGNGNCRAFGEIM